MCRWLVWDVGCGLYHNSVLKAFAVLLWVSPRHVPLRGEPGTHVRLYAAWVGLLLRLSVLWDPPHSFGFRDHLPWFSGQNSRACPENFCFACVWVCWVNAFWARLGEKTRKLTPVCMASSGFDSLPQSACFCLHFAVFGYLLFFLWSQVFSFYQRGKGPSWCHIASEPWLAPDDSNSDLHMTLFIKTETHCHSTLPLSSTSF